jgi:uncharacterized protein YjbI with pentapeptide repeats
MSNTFSGAGISGAKISGAGISGATLTYKPGPP